MMTVAQIPEPFRFNPLKHHLGWVVYCLERLKMLPCDDILQSELITNVREINANYVDVYTGTYSIEELILQIGSNWQIWELRTKKVMLHGWAMRLFAYSLLMMVPNGFCGKG
jgi:hypothetical protein